MSLVSKGSLFSGKQDAPAYFLNPLFFQVSTQLRQRSGLPMGEFGRRRISITSAAKYTETCHDSLLVNIGH